MDYMTPSSCMKLTVKDSTLGMKHVFREPHCKSRHFSVIGPSYSLLKPKVLSQKISQPPSFLVGGFVGSKSVEHKNSSNNYSNLLGQIISLLTIQETSIWNREQPSLVQRMSNARRNLISPVNSIPLNIHFNNIIPSNKLNSTTSNSTISLPIATIPASSQLTIAKQEAIVDDSTVLCNFPVTGNTIKDCSSKGGKSTATEMDFKNCDHVRRTKDDVSTFSNPWIKDIISNVSDTDSDSDEDCVDFHSENGEIVDSMKWNGDILSPISSPINPPQSTAQQLVVDYDYDSDESDVWDSYDRDDSDEEQKERDLAEQRILDANRRWEENITREDESAPSYTKKKKTVHFPSTNLASVRPMLTWSHAHRIARKSEWEQLARDSVRFRERIASTASVLAPVLDPKHRANVWKRLHCETQ